MLRRNLLPLLAAAPAALCQASLEERARARHRFMSQGDVPGDVWLDIMPNASLKGWTRISIPPDQPLPQENQWSVEKGMLVCSGKGGHDWLRWDRELANLLFEVEWRFTKLAEDARYNSGIFVRNSADGRIWHQAQTGSASGGYLFGNTLVKGEPKRLNLREQMKESRVLPAGEWNTFLIRAEGPKITVSVNGAVTSEFPECEVLKGYVGLEAEGYRIEFRKLRVKELAKTE